MAERRLSNVLPFESPGVAPISADAAHLLTLCRDRLVHGVATAFAGNLEKAHDDLLGMADRATSLEHQQLYFAALEFLAQRGHSLLQQFRAAYVAHFDASLAALQRGRRLERPAERGELSLIDTDDFERDLAVGKLSARAACNCANQLTALERRLAVLLHLPRVSQDENPLYPRALFNAMLDALGELGAGEQLALNLLQVFERQTSVELPGIYNDLNRELVEGGILPKIPVGLVPPAQRSDLEGLSLDRDPQGAPQSHLAGGPELPVPAPQSPIGIPGGGIWGTMSTPVDPAPLAGGDDVFAQLARAIQASVGATPTTPVGFLPAAVDPAIPSGYGGAPALGAAQLMQALTSLQHGHKDTRDLPGLGSVYIDPFGGKVLQQLRSTPMASWSHPVDAVTIDIVAMLFDAIFNDPDLPAALRAEIARLQIPILKVALMDKTFFSNRRHPARRLLDVIAGAGIGRDESEGARLTAEIRGVVDRVVSDFETDLDIFAEQVETLEAFLEEEEVRAQSLTNEAVIQLEEQDRQALARTRVDTAIASRAHRRAIPTLVADFLNRHWRLVLIKGYLDSGEQGKPWLQAVATMDDLLWSIEPKSGPEDRTRLLTTLPDLLKRLRTSLEALEIADAWDPFFAQLIRLHVAALHNEAPELGGPPGKPQSRKPGAPAARITDEATGLRTLALADSTGGIAFHTREEPAGAPSIHSTGDRHLQLAQSLAVGAWVEFASVRGTRKTLRLNWVSELRGVYLFTNRQGENALTLAATSLADHLRKGTARILSQDRLTDRAVAQLLATTERPGGTLGITVTGTP